MILLSASDLRLLYGEVEIFANVNLQVDEGARIGIVGPNGGGKTSLLRLMVGENLPNGGRVSTTRSLRMGYVPQRSEASGEGTLGDEVMKAFEGLLRLEEDLAASALDIQVSDEEKRRDAERKYAALLRDYESRGGYDYQNLMERVADGVGLHQATLATSLSAASGGERTRTALAKALLTDPDLLIMDEPTNYLDFKGLGWLEDFLAKFSHAFVVVSHDRYFLDKVATQIWELERGKLQVFRGNYSKYRLLKDEQVARQRIEYDRQQEVIAKEEDFIARYHAGQRSKEARGRATRLRRVERLDRPTEEHTVSISGLEAERTGLSVLRTQDLRVGFRNGTESTTLLALPDVNLQRGSRAAIVGPNGIGKTTLVRTFLGNLAPISGSVILGHNVKPGYYSQGSLELPEDMTVLDALLDVKGLEVPEARSYLARFLFRGDDVFKSVSDLSGGERSRLAIARLMIKEPNVLILDEPTTHLDIPSREALEKVLLSYSGALLFVSHDRHLISLLADQLWIAENGTVEVLPYGFEQWQQSLSDAEVQKARSRAQGRRRRGLSRTPAQPKKEPPPDYEQLIADLEARLVKVEGDLDEASKRQDVDEVARLGDEHNQIRAQLEEAWSAWGG